MDEIAAFREGVELGLTDRIDLYLLHWRGKVPLVETAEAMEGLVAADKILNFAAARDGTAARVARAWLLAQNGAMVITKSGSIAHVRQNCAVSDLRLSDIEIAQLDALVRAPRGWHALNMLDLQAAQIARHVDSVQLICIKLGHVRVAGDLAAFRCPGPKREPGREQIATPIRARDR